jgi:hypothetical protein
MNKRFLPVPSLLVVFTALLVWATSACKRQTSPTPGSQPAPEPKTIVQIHFAGAANISSDTNSAFFTNEFCSAEAVALENQTLDKLSHAPGIWFKEKLPTGASDGSAQLRPLLDDFLKSEWIFAMRDVPASPEYALAIHLGTNRAGIWQTNLRSLLESWTKIPAKDIPGGWELKKDLPPNLFRIVVAGDWIIAGCGQDNLPLADAWSQSGKIPASGTNWLTAELDWPRLAQVFPKLAKFDFPAFNLQAIGSNSNLWLTGNIHLSQPLPPLVEWKTPADMIHAPLTSFTAVRGFTPWLTNQSWAKPLELSPAPDQLFSWSQGQMALQTYVAVPVQNATNALAQLSRNLETDTNWQKNIMPAFGIDSTAYRIFLKNIPVAAPEILALPQTYGDYLFADVFPNLPGGKAPPPELFESINKSNLVFYHWETTSARLKDLPQLTQLGLLLTHRRQLNPNSPAQKWLDRIGSAPGDNVTVVTQKGLSELAFTRDAPTGFTAIELIALANWLEAPNFPGCDLSMPTPHFMPFHKPLKKLSGTAPATPPPPVKK